MPNKPSSYELLKEIHNVVGRLETKLDARITSNEKRLDLTETKLDRIAGKIGIGVMFVTLLVTGIFSLTFDWLKSKF